MRRARPLACDPGAVELDDTGPSGSGINGRGGKDQIAERNLPKAVAELNIVLDKRFERDAVGQDSGEPGGIGR